MVGLVLNAVAARRVQALAVTLLAAAVVAVAATTPFYVYAMAIGMSDARAAAAPPPERVVSVTGRVPIPGNQLDRDPLDEIRSIGERAADTLSRGVPHEQPTLGLRLPGGITSGDSYRVANLAYRDGVCAHVRIDGECPRAADTVMIARRLADQLGLSLGGTLTFRAEVAKEPRRLRVVGFYDVEDRAGPYWTGSGTLLPGGADSSVLAEALFAPREALLAMQPKEATASYEAVVGVAAYRPLGHTPFRDRLRAAERQMTGTEYTLHTEAGALGGRLVNEVNLFSLSVVVAGGELALLCWFALFLAVRHSAYARRADLGLLKLRGSSRWRTWRLSAGQTLLPLLAGTILGLPAAYGVVRALGATIDDPQLVAPAVELAAAAVALAVVGASGAAALAGRRSNRGGVLDLLREVPESAGRRRTAVIELTVAAVAAAAAYQVQATAGDVAAGSVGAAGFGLLGPGLLALAAGLCLARALPVVSGRLADRALRSGRAAAALAGAYVARRPDTRRAFALLVVAVTLLGVAAAGWDRGRAARELRAAQELGAARVLSVEAASRQRLLSAVRAADPEGRYAMAVAVSGGGNGWTDGLLAVDSPRFARVASWLPGYGVARASDIAQALRPGLPDAVLVGDGELILDATGAPEQPPTVVRLRLVTPSGEPVDVHFGPVTAVRGTYRATVAGCPDGCRLVGVDLTAGSVAAASGVSAAAAAAGIAANRPPPTGAGVELHGLAQGGRTLVASAEFGDVTRWRRDPSNAPGSLRVTAGRTGLSLTVTAACPAMALRCDTGVLAVDTPVPVVAVLAGAEQAATMLGDPRIALFDAAAVPVSAARTVPALPRLGARGALVDLESADRAAGGGGTSALEVWLTGDAPASIVDRLRAGGVTVRGERTTATEQARLAGQGPAVAQRFQIVAAVIGLLLASAVMALGAAVDRQWRAAELGALRRQGIPRRIVRAASTAEYTAMVCAAVASGAIASLATQLVAEVKMPVFSDGWRVLPVPGLVRPVPVAVAGVGALAVLAIVAATAVWRLARAVNGGAYRGAQ
jgi:hypothetical protein